MTAGKRRLRQRTVVDHCSSWPKATGGEVDCERPSSMPFCRVLPLVEELQKLQPGGTYPLVEDPFVSKRTVFQGMFVVRPAFDIAVPLRSPSKVTEAVLQDIMEQSMHWTYNVEGNSGGGVISNFDGVDALRLGMQYTCCDAIMLGTGSLLSEGLPLPDGTPGYVCQGETVCQWPQLSEHDPNMFQKFLKQRGLWQRLGTLSPRRERPAHLLITQSGNPDVLRATMYTGKHAFNGERYECYIVTSVAGARRLLDHGEESFSEQQEELERLRRCIIAVSPPDNEHVVDVAQLPRKLYDELDIRLVNHDGGARVLRQFCAAGVLPQLNLSMMVDHAQMDVLKQRGIQLDEKHGGEPFSYFFSSTPQGQFPSAVARHPVYALVSDEDDDCAPSVAVVILDMRHVRKL